MRKVFIPNLGQHDFSKAERFGLLVEIAPMKVNPTGVDGIAQLCNECFDDAQVSEDDLLLVCSHQVFVAIAAFLMFTRFGKVNFLILDAKAQDYVVRTVTKDTFRYANSSI